MFSIGWRWHSRSPSPSPISPPHHTPPRLSKPSPESALPTRVTSPPPQMPIPCRITCILKGTTPDDVACYKDNKQILRFFQITPGEDECYYISTPTFPDETITVYFENCDGKKELIHSWKIANIVQGIFVLTINPDKSIEFKDNSKLE